MVYYLRLLNDLTNDWWSIIEYNVSKLIPRTQDLGIMARDQDLSQDRIDS